MDAILLYGAHLTDLYTYCNIIIEALIYCLEVADSSVPVWCDYWFLCSVWRLLVLLFPLFSLEVAGSSVHWFLCSV
ncbi:hypothetical protein EMCRGX_G023769 [Ephydatia muelleri]